MLSNIHDNNQCISFLKQCKKNSLLFFLYYRLLNKKLYNHILMADNKIIHNSQRYIHYKITTDIQISHFTNCDQCNETINTIHSQGIISLKDQQVNMLLFDNGIYKTYLYTGSANRLNIVICNFPISFDMKIYLVIICEQDLDLYINNQQFADSQIECNIIIQTSFDIQVYFQTYGSNMNLFNITYELNHQALCNIYYLINNENNLSIHDKFVCTGENILNVEMLAIGENSQNFKYISSIHNKDENNILTVQQNIRCFASGNCIIKPFVDIQHKNSILSHEIYTGKLNSHVIFFFMLKNILELEVYQIMYQTFYNKFYSL